MTKDATEDPLMSQLNGLLPLATAALRNARNEADALMDYMDKLVDQEWVDKLPEASLDMDLMEFLSTTAPGHDLPLKHNHILKASSSF